jgi:acetyltransferase-like isoleucine patch superfamily enzyme
MNQEPGFVHISISDLPGSCFKNEAARSIRGSLSYPAKDADKLRSIDIFHHGDKNPNDFDGVEINLKSIPSLSLRISNSNQKVFIGANNRGRWIFRLWGQTYSATGNGVTSNGVDCFLNDGGRLIIGDDCMFASEITLHVGDNHAIFNVRTGELLNYWDTPSIVFGEHVWVAQRSMVRSNTSIGAGSVIGGGSIARGEFPPCTLIVGSPARVVKEGISWTRTPNGRERKVVAQTLKRLGAWTES